MSITREELLNNITTSVAQANDNPDSASAVATMAFTLGCATAFLTDQQNADTPRKDLQERYALDIQAWQKFIVENEEAAEYAEEFYWEHMCFGFFVGRGLTPTDAFYLSMDLKY